MCVNRRSILQKRDTTVLLGHSRIIFIFAEYLYGMLVIRTYRYVGTGAWMPPHSMNGSPRGGVASTVLTVAIQGMDMLKKCNCCC